MKRSRQNPDLLKCVRGDDGRYDLIVDRNEGLTLTKQALYRRGVPLVMVKSIQSEGLVALCDASVWMRLERIEASDIIIEPYSMAVDPAVPVIPKPLFPALREVVGELTINHFAEFPRLERIDGYLVTKAGARMPQLRQINGKLIVWGATDTELPRLEYVREGMNLRGRVLAPQLHAVGGEVIVTKLMLDRHSPPEIQAMLPALRHIATNVKLLADSFTRESIFPNAQFDIHREEVERIVEGRRNRRAAMSHLATDPILAHVLEADSEVDVGVGLSL